MIGDLYVAASRLLADVVSGLSEGPTPVPTRRGVTVGQVPWGVCDQLWVSIGRAAVTNNPPVEGTVDSQGQCAAAFFLGTLTVALIRCFPVVDAAGNPPSPAAVGAVAQAIAADEQTLAAVVPCALADQVAEYLLADYTFTSIEMIGPEGGRISLESASRVALSRG